MTTVEQKLMQALGELQFQLIVQSHQLEEAQQRIVELETDREPQEQEPQ